MMKASMKNPPKASLLPSSPSPQNINGGLAATLLRSTSRPQSRPESALPDTSTPAEKTNRNSWILLSFNYLAMLVGSISSSLLSRFYFIHGGSSRWVSTWVQSAGFPLLFISICLSPDPKSFSLITRKLLLASTFVGLLTGVNNFLFSWGISYLSVSTSSLLLSCQLAFNLVLSILLVKQKIHFTNLNCVILLTLSFILLALGSSHDRPRGVTQTQFFVGFVSILGAAAMFALYLPVMEIVYKSVTRFKTVLEIQAVIQMVAALLSTGGMVWGGGFEEMKKEGESVFDLGERMYWLTLGFTVVCWQMCFMGTAGVVYMTTSLTGGVCMTSLLPMNVVAGVLAFGDEFGGQKVVSTVLCVWGFACYLYGEYMRKKPKEEMRETTLAEIGRIENGDSV